MKVKIEKNPKNRYSTTSLVSGVLALVFVVVESLLFRAIFSEWSGIFGVIAIITGIIGLFKKEKYVPLGLVLGMLVLAIYVFGK